MHIEKKLIKEIKKYQWDSGNKDREAERIAASILRIVRNVISKTETAGVDDHYILIRKFEVLESLW